MKLVLVGVILVSAGCTEPPPPPPPAKSFQDLTVRVAVPEARIVRELMDRHTKVWADRTGARVELVAVGSEADVRVFTPPEMGRLVAKGELAALSLAAQKNDGSFQYERILSYEAERNMAWGGKIYALPLLGESVFCIYRADLLEDPKHSAALDKLFHKTLRYSYHAGGPSTWQEFAIMAEYFASTPGWDGAGANRSLTSLPSSADDFERDFNLIAAPFARRAVNLEKSATLSAQAKSNLLFSYQLSVDNVEPLIDAPGFTVALQFMQQLQAFRPPASSSQPLDAFRDGHAVLAIATLADIPRLQDGGSRVRDKFAVCRVPGSSYVYDDESRTMVHYTGSDGNVVPYHGHGGWMAGLAAKAAQPQAANDLLLFLSSPAVSQEIVCETAWGGGPTRSSHLDNRAAWANYELSPPRTLQLIAALDGYYRPTLLNPTFRLRLPDQAEYVRLFANRISAALTQNQPADAALKDVARSWRDLTNTDQAAHLRDYRLSQGLR